MTSQITPTAEHELQPIPDWPAQRASSLGATKEATMNTRIDWPTLYAALSEPFEPSLIRYRAGATNRDKTQAQALPYVDPRAYEDRLNRLVPGDWHVTFEPWGNDRIICRLTIHGVTRSSTGEASDSPNDIAGTSAEAQAFKRSCAKFGLGRHLYGMQLRWLPYNSERKSFDAVPASIAASVSVQATTTDQDHEIGPERASRMCQELRRKGLTPGAQVGFASQVTHRPVRDLASLTPVEASTVWRAAIARASRSRAQGKSGRDP